MMDGVSTDFYSTVAEVTLALAALAGVLVVFREDAMSPYLTNRLERFVRFSLIIMVGSLVPMIMREALVSEIPIMEEAVNSPDDVWAWCSGIYMAIVVGLMWNERVLLTDPENDEKRLTYALYAGSLMAVLFSLANVLDWREEFPVMLGISWALMVVGSRFVILLRIVTEDDDEQN